MVKNPRIILIVGTSYIGKSTLCLRLGRELNIRQIVDLDVIREIVRNEKSSKEAPYIHLCSTTAWQHGGNESDKNVIFSYLKYCKALEKYVKRIIDRAYILGKDTIIEGVHLVPSFFKKYFNKKNFEMVLLIASEENHFNNIGRRKKEFGGKSVRKYYERLPKARLIQEYLIRDAITNGIPIIENHKLDEAEKDLIKVLNKNEKNN